MRATNTDVGAAAGAAAGAVAYMLHAATVLIIVNAMVHI